MNTALRAGALIVLLIAPALLPAQNTKGKKLALLVGVRDYDHASLTPLKHTERDAEELAKVLDTGRAFDQVVVLSTTRGGKNAKAKPTTANVRAELKALLAKVTRHDLVIVALAGHGLQLTITDPDTKKERSESFFCPSDAKPKDTKDLAELRQTMIPISELFKDLDESGAGVKLLLVDACRNEPKLGRNLDIDTLPRPTKGMAALFSCKGGERAFESDKLSHGVFFHHVIDGLKGGAKNSDGEVTWGTLSEYVAKRVSREVPKLIGGGAKQTPHEIRNIEGESPVLIPPAKVVVQDKGKDKDGGKSDEPKDKDFVPLFDGKTLKGWRVVRRKGSAKGGPSEWEVEDGILVGAGGVPTLLTEGADWDNFHLRMEVKLNERTSAGLGVRAQEPAAFASAPYGYNVSLGSTLSGILTLTSKVRQPGPPMTKKGRDTTNQPDEWFLLEVICKGDLITVKVDGKETAKWKDPNHLYKKGHIVLTKQQGFGTIRFRKIEIKQLAVEK